MKRIQDNGPVCTGHIKSAWVSGDGAERRVSERANTVVYAASDLMARILGGDADAVPRYIGFIYGTDASPLLEDPDMLPLDVRRAHSWHKIAQDVAAVSGNVAICPFAMSPSVARDGDITLYNSNAVTFTGHTGLVQEYGFDTAGSSYAPDIGTITRNGSASLYFYHAILLNRVQKGADITYTPFSRAALDTSPYTAKPHNFELAVYWTIVFK